MGNFQVSILKADQKEVFLKYLFDGVWGVALAPISDHNYQPNSNCLKIAHQISWQQLSAPALIKVATVIIPMLILSWGGEAALAWERKGSGWENQETPEVVAPSLTIQRIISHEIQSGDTLWELSQEYQVSPQAIAQYNAIAPQELLQIGETLAIPLPQKFRQQQPQLLQQPLGAIGGAFFWQETEFPNHQSETTNIPSLPLKFPNFGVETTFTSPIPQIIPHRTEEIAVSEKTFPAMKINSSPIEQFLADVDELQANYEPNRKTLKTNQWYAQAAPELSNHGKVFSSEDNSPATVFSDGSVATAPIKVEFYNRFLIPPIGETVNPELPPLSSPDQYLPDSPQKFKGYIWPAKGVFTSGYGMRWGRMHGGIDIAAPIGTPILAAAPGEVVVAGWNSGGYGKLVKLKHPDGSLTLYAHNHRILVRKGQEVDQGQQIAEMGSTGRSTGPHLHFEIHPAGKGAANPLAYLPKR